MDAAVGNILETLDKKPSKAITKFQTPCLEGESRRGQSPFVESLQPHFHPTKKLHLRAAVEHTVPAQNSSKGSPLVSRLRNSQGTGVTQAKTLTNTLLRVPPTAVTHIPMMPNLDVYI